ncbi:hypothetical protein [Vibrio gallicus]|uniref:hypothetical protein n=1 Tax=Vibrio gallicus TaxID=190897 RepID=UPI0021C41712|nr:hypothetical protein [Vibrio gallicus]
MKLLKLTAVVSSILVLSACNGNIDDSKPKSNLSADQQKQINNYVGSAGQGFAFSSDSPLYNALDSLYFFSTQDKITPQNISAGMSDGIAKVLKAGVFAKLPAKAQQQAVTFEGDHAVTLSDTGAKTKHTEEWHCYGSLPMTVVVDNKGMTIDGTLTEYKYSGGCKVTNPKVFSYNFAHAHIDANFVVDSGTITDLTTHTSLKPNQILLSAIESDIQSQFGTAWLEQWKAGAQSAGKDFLKLENGRIKYNQIPAGMVDFNTLNQSKLLAGTVFGSQPGGAPASPKWCRIVNIPQGLDLNSQKQQTIIASNCARSVKRYCEGHGSGFPAGMQSAASPVAWGEREYNYAMDNTVLQQQKNQIGHFEQHGQTQNAFTTGSAPFSGALKAVYGYSTVKDANPSSTTFNNAGANSFAGHAGHCQNEMASWVNSTGLSFKMVTANGGTGIDFLTQNFSK